MGQRGCAGKVDRRKEKKKKRGLCSLNYHKLTRRYARAAFFSVCEKVKSLLRLIKNGRARARLLTYVRIRVLARGGRGGAVGGGITRTYAGPLHSTRTGCTCCM